MLNVFESPPAFCACTHRYTVYFKYVNHKNENKILYPRVSSLLVTTNHYMAIFTRSLESNFISRGQNFSVWFIRHVSKLSACFNRLSSILYIMYAFLMKVYYKINIVLVVRRGTLYNSTII